MTDDRNFETDLIALEVPLRRFAHRFLRGEEDVNDLVQETLVKALMSRHQFQTGTALKSWLFTIMRNTFCTMYHKSKREPVLTNDFATFRLTCDAPQHAHIRYGELMRAVAKLPEDTRTALMLTASGTSYEKAAEICGCKTGTIKSRVNRARYDLAVAIGDISPNIARH